MSEFTKADKEVRAGLPPGVKLLRTLRGHESWIGKLAWSPNGSMLATPSEDHTVRLWDADSGECLRTLKGHEDAVYSAAFSPADGILATCGNDKTVRLWRVADGAPLHTLSGHSESVFDITFSADGRELFSAAFDGKIRVWDPASGRLLRTLKSPKEGFLTRLALDPRADLLSSAGRNGVQLWTASTGAPLRSLDNNWVNGVAFDPIHQALVTGGRDETVKIWDPTSGRLMRSLEGHTGSVRSVAVDSIGRLIASKSDDGTVRLWDAATGNCVATLAEPSSTVWPSSVAFHPRLPILAAVGSDPGTEKDDRDRIVHLYQLDLVILLGSSAQDSAHYVNAKVVLVGDSGVGKSGLGLVLAGQPFAATDSTHGRTVWTFDSREVTVNGIPQTRETLLWDLAGQPGYRVIHQFHLNEVAVALVVFDARSETDPLAGVRHWERALRLAQQRQGSSAVPMKKFLVSARNDRGGVSVSKERIEALLKEFHFDGYFETSAKEGWDVDRLRAELEKCIDWEHLPEVASSKLFAEIKEFLLETKKSGKLLATAVDLYDAFSSQNPDAKKNVPDLYAQFNTCIDRLANRDLIRRLTFGGYVLLQPELLDAYASSMVNTAKEEPDGLGSLAEEVALSGKFFVPPEQKVADASQEQLLLHATVEELVCHDLALRENADDGRYLVFPSQFNRDYEDAPDPKGKEVAITFEGPVQSLYATLAVRLGHSGLFSTGRMEMWRNAALFTAKAGGKCGIFLHEFAEARGRLILFYDENATAETRFHFEEFVLAHTRRKAVDGSVALVRFFVCANGHPVPDEYVQLSRSKGKKEFVCPCGEVVPLIEPIERIHFPSELQTMEKSADKQRDIEGFLVSATGEMRTPSFLEWAGADLVILSLVFTDLVGSTALEEEIKAEAMREVRHAHFAQSRALIKRFNGREVKTIGDSFMVAFKSTDLALDYALALQANPGEPSVRLRAGIHSGPMSVEGEDVFGTTVNFAARVVGAINGPEIWLSDQAKQHIATEGAKRHRSIEWEPHDSIELKGFPGTFRLWSLKKRIP